MSELKILEQKIDNQRASQDAQRVSQDTHNGRVEQLLTSLVEQMTTFVAFQSRAEERQIADKEWQKRVESHQDKQDDKIDKAQNTADKANNQSLSNGKWINFGVAILTGIAIFIGTEIAKKIIEMLGS